MMSNFLKSFNAMATPALAIIVILSFPFAYVAVSNHRSDLMAKDIRTAMEKGVDPMSIRCAYTGEDDRLCIAYAAARGAVARVEIAKSK